MIKIEEKPKYPVYIISKGRYSNPLTAKFLERDGVEFKIVVEPQEADEYRKTVGENRVEVLPFSNLSMGSIPARNWCWENSIDNGAEKHWILDDNIRRFDKRKIIEGQVKRKNIDSKHALYWMEKFSDSYKNIAILGPNYSMFSPDDKVVKPFRVNMHVYSMLLIKNEIKYRWRGRYNEDTDLCLQVLSGGLCTVQICAFTIKKMATMTMKGGNMDQLYTGDGRLVMARSLERMWPGIVETKRRFGRPQHVVNWRKFKNELIPIEKMEKV